jgi:hypothetical protein
MGRCRPRLSARAAGVPGPHRHPSGAQPAANAGAAARGLRRRMAAGAVGHEPRRGRRRRARESLSMAMLTVLETLGPAERAVFVLREVFDTPYARSQRRSANHLPPFARSPTGLASTSLLDVHGCRSPRRAKGDSGPVPCRHPARRPAGPPRRLGPRRRCPRRRRRRGSRCSSPVKGAERVASLLLRGLRTVAFEAAAVWLNGSPAIRIDARTAFNAAVSVVVEDGRITHIYVVANPQELARLDGITPLTRS